MTRAMTNPPHSIGVDVERELPWLTRGLGFKKIEDYYDPKADFGNSFATFSVGCVMIRFARDKGDVLASVASCHDPSSWHILAEVCEYVSGRREGASTLVEFGELFRNHYEKIAQALGPDFARAKPQLDDLYQKGLKEYYDGLVASHAARRKNSGSV